MIFGHVASPEHFAHIHAFKEGWDAVHVQRQSVSYYLTRCCAELKAFHDFLMTDNEDGQGRVMDQWDDHDDADPFVQSRDERVHVFWFYVGMFAGVMQYRGDGETFEYYASFAHGDEEKIKEICDWLDIFEELGFPLSKFKQLLKIRGLDKVLPVITQGRASGQIPYVFQEIMGWVNT